MYLGVYPSRIHLLYCALSLLLISTFEMIIFACLTRLSNHQNHAIVSVIFQIIPDAFACVGCSQ